MHDRNIKIYLNNKQVNIFLGHKLPEGRISKWIFLFCDTNYYDVTEYIIINR